MQEKVEWSQSVTDWTVLTSFEKVAQNHSLIRAVY